MTIMWFRLRMLQMPCQNLVAALPCGNPSVAFVYPCEYRQLFADQFRLYVLQMLYRAVCIHSRRLTRPRYDGANVYRVHLNSCGILFPVLYLAANQNAQEKSGRHLKRYERRPFQKVGVLFFYHILTNVKKRSTINEREEYAYAKTSF